MLLTNFTIQSVYCNFLPVFYCNFTGAFKSFLLRFEIA